MLLGFVVGIGLGWFYFGGLYLTIRWMTEVPHPGILMVASMFLRFASVIVGVYFLSQMGIIPALMGLMGMILVRIGMVRLSGGKGYEH